MNIVYENPNENNLDAQEKAEASKSKDDTPKSENGESQASPAASPKHKKHQLPFGGIDPPSNTSVNRFAYQNVNISRNYHLVMTKFDASDILLEPKPVKVKDESEEELT